MLRHYEMEMRLLRAKEVKAWKQNEEAKTMRRESKEKTTRTENWEKIKLHHKQIPTRNT